MTVDQRKNLPRQKLQFHVKVATKRLESEMIMDELEHHVNYIFAENLSK